MQKSLAWTVLVADDDPAIRDLLAEFLEDYNCRVLQAADGKEAMVTGLAGKLDLLITDLVMPEQEGIETIRQFRKAFPSLKIIAISGQDDIYLRMARALGADATLRKPLNLEAVSMLLKRWKHTPPHSEQA